MQDEQKSKDDLADALSRLASGDAPSAPDEIPTDEIPRDEIPTEQVPLDAASSKPKRPAAPKTPGGLTSGGLTSGGSTSDGGIFPAGARDRASTSSSRPNARGVQPPSSRPSSITPPRKPTGAVKPPKPVRPGAPELSPPPAAPVIASIADPSDIGSSLANVIDDDDAVIVPAPSPAAFAHRPSTKPAKAAPIYARLTFRRTIIPILLTMGIALPGCAVWWAMQDEDSPLKSLGLKFPLAFVALGLVLLALGIVNMIQVKKALAVASAAREKSGQWPVASDQ